MFENTTLLDSLKNNYSSGDSKKKSKLHSVLTTWIVKMYRCMQELWFKCFCLKGRLFSAKKNTVHTKKMYKIKRIHEFYYWDDIRRATAGKKESITKSNAKKDIYLIYLPIFMRSMLKREENVIIRQLHFIIPST